MVHGGDEELPRRDPIKLVNYFFFRAAGFRFRAAGFFFGFFFEG